jgi:hypothetical protein
MVGRRSMMPALSSNPPAPDTVAEQRQRQNIRKEGRILVDKLGEDVFQIRLG